MSKQYLLDGYRFLSVEEKELREKAIHWLLKKRVRAEEIKFLNLKQIDQVNKLINIKREGKIAIVNKQIAYRDTPFDFYMGCFPGMKSNRFIFVRWAWAGRKAMLCSPILTEELEEIIEEKAKPVLTLSLKFGNIRVAKMNWHITN